MSDDVRAAGNGNGSTLETIAVSALTTRKRLENVARNHKNYVPNDVLFTPPHIIEALGITFDMDVCSPENGIDWIPAKKFITEKENGLTTKWEGLIWMNPPYSNVTPWIDKWLDHKNGFCLVPFSAAKWCVKLWDSSAYGVLMDQTTIKFVTPAFETQGIFMPVGIWAIGDKAIEILKSSPIGKVR